jgi:predicted dehydrogenase
MRPTYKVAILGAGVMAGLSDNPRRAADAVSHVRGIALTPTLRLEGVYDPILDRARRLCANWGGKAYHDVNRLLGQVRPDIVVIASSTDSHVAAAMAVLQSPFAPRVIVLEKPPAYTRHEWRRLARVGNHATNTRVIVNLTRRFDPRYQRLAQAISRDSYGRLVDGVFTYYGGWFNNGIHAVDTLRVLLGEGLCVTRSSAADLPAADPSRTVTLAVRGTDALIALVPFDKAPFTLFELQLRFTKGRLRIEDFGRRFTIERVRRAREGGLTLGPPVPIFAGTTSTPIQNMYRMCRAVLRGHEPRELRCVTLKSVAKTMEILFDGL